MPSKKPGKIYVTSVKSDKGKLEYNKVPGALNVVVHTAGYGKWSTLSPFVMKDNNGHILENIWQGGKVYEKTRKNSQKLSRYRNDSPIIWEQDAETHIDSKTKKVNDLQRKWRKRLLNNKFAVRYPNTWRGKTEVSYSFSYDFEKGEYDESKQYGYVESRKALYVKMYQRFLPENGTYKELLGILKSGKDVNICEVDGPKQEKLEYYTKKYPYLEKDFIKNGTVLVTREILDMFLNDPEKPYGHGFCIASQLLEDSEKN